MSEADTVTADPNHYWIADHEKDVYVPSEAARLGVRYEAMKMLLDCGMQAGAIGSNGERRVLLYCHDDHSGGLLACFDLPGITEQEREVYAYNLIDSRLMVRRAAASAAKIGRMRGIEEGTATLQRGLRMLCGAASADDVLLLTAELRGIAANDQDTF